MEQGIGVRCTIQILTISIGISEACYCMNTVCLTQVLIGGNEAM